MSDQLSETAKLLTGREYPPADEQEYIGRMVADLQKQLNKIYPPGEMKRQAHPKMHGCVKAEFTVLNNLDKSLQIGVFKEPKTFQAVIRFSNANTFVKHDINKDLRGMSIKLLDVPGEKLLNEEKDALTQDFIMVSHDIFISKNVKEFHGVLHAFTSGPLALFLFFVPMHIPILLRLLASSKKCENVLGTPYWSTTPYLFGDNRAVKYHVAPASNPSISGVVSKADENYLRTNMVKTLSEQDALFDFFIQFQTDPKLMPVEDPTVRWTSPFIKVATIRIPSQRFDTEEQNHFGDGLSFSPWHSLPDHRPLGGLNRARKHIYYEMSKFWRSNNENYENKS